MEKKLINIFSSVRTIIVLASLVPLLFTGLTLSYNSIHSRINDNMAALRYKGIQYSKHIAAASEYGLFSGDMSYLENVARSQFDDRDVYSIVIYSPDNKVISRYFSPYTNIPEKDIWAKTLKFRQAVYPSSLAIDDNDTIHALPESNAVNEDNNRIMGWVELALTTEPFQSNQGKMIRQETIITSIIVIFSALVALLIASIIIRPIRRLQKVSQEMRDGNLAARIDKFSIGEFRELESTFNEMATHLGNSQKTLKEKIYVSTKQLKETINELIDRNNELDKARLDAQEANEIKGKFLANISHEIRTPINAIIGFIRLLHKTHPDKEQAEYIHVLEQSSMHLLSLINNILDVARIESDAFKIKLGAFDLFELLDETTKMLSSMAHRKALDLTLDIDPKIPRDISSDAYHLKQVVINLINNAIKFTDTGYVSIQVTQTEESQHQKRIRFEVNDTGIGMTAEQISRIYEPFYQVDSSYSRLHEGTGLGLAIVKSIIIEMKGQYGVESMPGRGTKFWFEIPVRYLSGVDSRDEISDTDLQITICDPQPVSLASLHNLFSRRSSLVTDIAGYEALIATLSDDRRDNDIDILVIAADPRSSVSDEFESALSRICDLYSGLLLIMVGNENYSLPPGLETLPNLTWLVKPTTETLLWSTISSLTERSGERKRTDIFNRITDDKLGIYHDKSMLLAEDNEFNRLLVSAMMERTGIIITTATNGQTAVSLANEQHFDVILMDVHLPKLNGIEASTYIRHNDGPNRQTPIIAMTADVFASKDNNIHNAGINSVLIKPFDENRFWELIQEAIGVAVDNQAQIRSPGIRSTLDSVITRLLPKYYEQLPETIENIRQASRYNDIQRLLETLHHLKGATDYLHLEHISALIRQAEETAHLDPGQGNIREVIDRLLSELELEADDHTAEDFPDKADPKSL